MWQPYEAGTTLGERGSENGIILSDHEHELGARITLERETRVAPFAITCGVYGWMLHTRFFGSEAEALADYGLMQDGLSLIVDLIPFADDPDVDAKRRALIEAMNDFVSRFP
ncbi:MAG: hypothetical protein ACLQJ7_12095 [Syntrophobacteraceae bacterium]